MTETHTAHSNTEAVVNQFFTEFAARNSDAMLALFAEQVDFQVVGSANVPWTGSRTTHGEIAAFIDSVLNDVDTQKFEVDNIIVDGRNCVVLGTFEHRIKRTARTFGSPFALHIAVEDNKISTYRMYEDSYSAALAFACDS